MSPFAIDFAVVDSKARLSRAIGCEESFVSEVIAFNRAPAVCDPVRDGIVVLELRPSALHSTFDIPKKNQRRTGESRTVTEVHDRRLVAALKALSRRLDLFLRHSGVGYPSPSSYGFVSGGSTYKNAARHLGARMLLTADVKDFFHTISTDRVALSLMGAGIPSAGAATIADFVTVGGSLPLGFNTSPMLSNLVCLNMDQLFERLGLERGYTYTRYADDMAFSSDAVIPSREEVRSVLQKEGFCLADDKFRVSVRGQRQVVTGLSIADREAPRVPRAIKRKLRQSIYFCQKFGTEGHAEALGVSSDGLVNEIDGRIGYVQGIEPDLGESLRKKWREILRSEESHATYPRRSRRASDSATVLVDEAGWVAGGRRCFAMACVLVEDPEAARHALAALAKTRSDDFFYGGRSRRFDKKGFHYSDDPERAKDDVCRLLADIPLRASVAFADYSDELTFAQNYLKLFDWLITRRMAASDWHKMSIVCEAHQEIGVRRVEESVRERFVHLISRGGMRPRGLPTVRYLGKGEEALLSVPDYLLGVLGAYVCSPSVDFATKEVRRFEQLRDKFRLIRDFDNHRSYNRQRVISGGLLLQRPTGA